MEKSFAFVIFVLGILVAQVVCLESSETRKDTEQGSEQSANAIEPSSKIALETSAKKTETLTTISPPESKENEKPYGKKSEKQHDAEKNEENSDEVGNGVTDEETRNESSLPLLTCVLFKNDTACNTMCSIISFMYGNPNASGSCEQKYVCQCTAPKNATLEDYWKPKFNSDDVLQNIQQLTNLSEKILNIIKAPFKTPQQSVQDLKSVLPAGQLKKLSPKDIPVRKMIVKDEFDKPAIQKYTVEKVESCGMSLPSSKGYKENLVNALDKADGDVFAHIAREIRNSRNKLLNVILDKYLKEHNIENQPAESADRETLAEILDSALVNQIIKPTRGKKSPTDNRKRTSNSVTSSHRKQTTPKVAGRLRGSNITENCPFYAQSVPSGTPPAPPSKDKHPYILPSSAEGGIIQMIDDGKECNRCWEKPSSYEICFKRDSMESFFSWWNLKIHFRIQIYNYVKFGYYDQVWIIDGISIVFRRDPTGKITQEWSLQHSKFECTKLANGKVINENWKGEKKEGAVLYYKSMIDSWCSFNHIYMGKENCALY